MTERSKGKTVVIKTGDRFSNCVVIGFEAQVRFYNDKKQTKNLCLCKCDCGTNFTALKYRLKNGYTTSCRDCKLKLNGSLKVIDIQGQTFTYLTVIRRNGSADAGAALWLCKCKCGNELTTTKHQLSSGETKSCGCYSRTVTASKRVKLEGQIFGLLTIKEYLKNSKYVCLCTCGKEVIKKQQSLIEERTVLHCGSAICAAEPGFYGPILPLEEARTKGLKRYSDGKLCSRGHRSSKFVSTMGCVVCHRKTHKKYIENNPEKPAFYSKKSAARPKAKARRNAQLTERRTNDPIFRYTELTRSRLKKVLRSANFKKPSRTTETHRIRKELILVLERQGLSEKDLEKGKYELDHILPLCTFPWSSSEIGNGLVAITANSAPNLQFLTVEEHNKKTSEDALKYNWYNEALYHDHTDELIKKITEGQSLPNYFVGFEKKILAELLGTMGHPNE